MTNENEIMYGQHAIQVMVGYDHAQWACGKCGTNHGDDGKHAASWCCCTHRPCGCGAVITKRLLRCDKCRAKETAERWFAKPEKIWHGEWPLGQADGDGFFNNAEDLLEYLHDTGSASEMWLTSCTPNKPREFLVNEWCEDELPLEESVPNGKSIDTRINAILSEIGVLSWSLTGERLNVRDVLKRIGFELGEETE